MDELTADDVVSELQRRVAERRARGEYPVGLEEQLEAEFRHIMGVQHRDRPDFAPVHAQLAAAEHASEAIRVHGETSSRVPGGSTVHAVAARIVSRHTSQLADSTRVFGAELIQALREMERLVERRAHTDDMRLQEAIAAVIDRVAVVDHLASAILDLERRVGRLETGAARE